MRRRTLFFLVLLVLVLMPGCGRNGNAEVAELRAEVSALRKEMGQVQEACRLLRAEVRGGVAGRTERRAPAGAPARPVPAPAASGTPATAQDGTAAPSASRPPSASVRRTPPSIEEIKARREAMRDPKMREQLRAEHRARMEERRKRMEERRGQMRKARTNESGNESK